MAAQTSKSYLCVGSSSAATYDDADVIEVSAAAAAVGGSWKSGHQKRKRSQVVPHNVIEIDGDDDPDGVVIIGEKTSNQKNKQLVGHSIGWQKHTKDPLALDLAGPSTSTLANSGTSLVNSLPYLDPCALVYNTNPVANSGGKMKNAYDPFTLGFAYCDDYTNDAYDDDYTYDDDFEDFEYDSALNENDYNFNLAAKFDDLDIPPGVEATVPWLQKTDVKRPNKSKQIKIMDAEIDQKYESFKKFDTVDDFSDHHFFKAETRGSSVVRKPAKEWVKRIQHEWKLLEKDLPDTIFVRICEERMDLVRAVIMGPAGTPYHDGLFFFDVHFPPQFPNSPPKVYYHSGGLRLNPNLYNDGKVCLSLLNTWSGSGCEKWIPSKSTMLQVLVSIQALVLNAKPYFNEPGYAPSVNTEYGEQQAVAYNEKTFLLSCKTMLYSLRNPPKHFGDFVAGHFRKYGHAILVACKAYMDGAQVGCLVGDGVQDVDEGDKSCSVIFKSSLKRLFEELLMEFSVKGADCQEFLAQEVKAEAAKATDTTLRLRSK